MGQRLNLPDAAGVLHFVALSVRERKRAFARAEYANLAVEMLRFECDRHPVQLVAYVVGHNHIHFIVCLADGTLTKFLSCYKPGVTLQLDALAQSNERRRECEWLSSKGKRELWQDGKHSLPLYSADWIREKIAYVHQNPVRAELVTEPTDYQ